MDTVRYKAVLMAADTGSIKAAADALGYTPSGVSQLIGSLEKELNIVIFKRGKKGVTLTSPGELILPSIRSVVADEDKILQIAAELNGTVTGTVNVDSYHSLATLWLPDIIGEFQKDHPGVRVNIYEGTQASIAQRLATGKSDIAFFNDSIMKIKHDWFPIMEDRMVAVLPKDHPMAEAEAFPTSAFKGKRFIMPENGFDYDVMEILGAFDIKPDIRLTTFDSDILLDTVEMGLGVSMVNEAAISGKLEGREIVAIPVKPYRSIKMGVGLMSLEKASPPVKKFVEYTLKALETENRHVL